MKTSKQPVVITGASTGIGRATALHLDQLGFKVFAGVRKEADGEALMRVASERLTPILLDSPLLQFFDKEVKGLPGIPLSEVAKVMAQALTATRPKPQYLVGPGAKKMKNLARLPAGLRDRLMYRAIYGRRP